MRGSLSPQRYNVRLVNGRSAKEGRVEIKIKGQWGTICSDHWTMLEAAVACKHAGQGYAQSALPVSGTHSFFPMVITSRVYSTSTLSLVSIRHVFRSQASYDPHLGRVVRHFFDQTRSERRPNNEEAFAWRIFSSLSR